MTTPSLTKGEQRQRDLVRAAAEILHDEGPGAVSHRKVAARASASLSATTYYFTGLDDLLGQAASLNFNGWIERAARVAAELENCEPPTSMDDAVEIVLKSCLPSDAPLENHYLQLTAAAEYPAVRKVNDDNRSALDDAIGTVLAWMGSRLSARLVLTVVDGAAVEALSEGRDIRETARALVRELFVSMGEFAAD